MRKDIAKKVFWSQLSIMKKILDLLEYKSGKESDEFIYLRKEVMDKTYEGLKRLFKDLETNKLIKKCSCDANLRKGYKDCEFCGGSGYRDYNMKTE